MNVTDAILTRRTIRKFQDRDVEESKLYKMVECAAMAASGANMQPLKYKIINKEDELLKIFPCTKWAGYLSDGAPKDGEKPHAYIAVLGDTDINSRFECDAGAAIANMMLAAVDMGLATCWLGAIEREKISEILNLSENLKVLYLLAVGYPAQQSRAVGMDGSVKYWVDESETVNVPKRSLGEILV